MKFGTDFEASIDDIRANAFTRLLPAVTFGLRVTALAGVAFVAGDMATGVSVLGDSLGHPDGPTCCLAN
jgi:hypothetical protein